MDDIKDLMLQIEMRLLEISVFLLEDEVDPSEVEALISLLLFYKRKLGQKECFKFMFIP